MLFKRHIEQRLEEWRNSNTVSKPLIVRGARQTGKTTSIKKFVKSYKNSILLNLEKESDLLFFNQFSDITTIAEALFCRITSLHQFIERTNHPYAVRIYAG